MQTLDNVSRKMSYKYDFLSVGFADWIEYITCINRVGVHVRVGVRVCLCMRLAVAGRMAGWRTRWRAGWLAEHLMEGWLGVWKLVVELFCKSVNKDE